MISNAGSSIPGIHCIVSRSVLVILLISGSLAKAASSQPAGNQSGALCTHCHRDEGQKFAGSAHAAAGMDCRACHGGLARYPVALAQMTQLQEAAEQAARGDKSAKKFDHGSKFRGKPSHRDVPELCGTCHSDVAKMNPYGLATDQWAQYKLSGHGRALYEKHNDKVAVCTDCHRTHDILKPKDPTSSVYPTNIPGTCGRCHADPKVMEGSNRSTHVLEQYKESVHGKGLLEKGDTGMPQCATCHGSHAAVPPGFRNVGHVCGRCHQNEERYFLESIHAKFEHFPRCVICHTRHVDQADHLIQRVAVSPENMQKTLAGILATQPAASIDDAAVQQAYAARRQPPVARFGEFCAKCHNPAREIGHRQFFGKIDETAVNRGNELFDMVRRAELQYAKAAYRVDQAQHGVLLVKDEAMMLEELRTSVVGLASLQHTLDHAKIKEAVAAQDALAVQINGSLDAKIRNLHWRHWGLIPMWAFIAIFVAALWAKYKQLKHQFVKPISFVDKWESPDVH